MPDRKMEVEARMTCPKCGGVPYILYRRQREPDSDIFENVLWPAPDSKARPPTSPTPNCPDCDVQLVRKAK